MPKPRPPYLHREETRHGAVNWYVREGHGPRIRIKAHYGSAEFWSEYRAALEGAPMPSKAAKANTLAWGLDRYRASSSWASLSNATRRQRENVFHPVIATAGTVPLKKITEETIRAGRERGGEQVSIPILPPLAASIAATKIGDMTYLVTETGRPWIKESFGNWFSDACRKAGCPGSAHGLRKAGATRAAERGASERQLMAIFGWATAKMASHYTRGADRKRLAHDAAQLLLPAQEQNEKRPHLEPGAGASANVRAKSGA